MTVYETQGTVLKIGNAASPEVFTAIPQVTSISGPDGTAPTIDTSNFGSVRREYIMGLADEGQMSVEMIFDASNTQHTLLRTRRNSRTATNFQLLYSDSPATTWSFTAFVLSVAQNLGVDDVVRTTVTLRITGAITES